MEDPKAQAGAWRGLWPADAAEADESRGAADRRMLAVEIGCGKGQFLCGMADLHPDWRFIGVEGHQSVVYHAMEKAGSREADNVRIVPSYLRSAADCFAENELDRIYLNFSDPWPKVRHEKRRLTAKANLEAYVRVLAPGGLLEFRTDNEAFFDWSVEQVAEVPQCHVELLTKDLHAGGKPAVTTEYEDKFAAAGRKICFLRISIVK